MGKSGSSNDRNLPDSPLHLRGRSAGAGRGEGPVPRHKGFHGEASRPGRNARFRQEAPAWGTAGHGDGQG